MIIEERLDVQRRAFWPLRMDVRFFHCHPPKITNQPLMEIQGLTRRMGAYCPTPIVDDALMAWIEEHVLVPTVHTMKRNR